MTNACCKIGCKIGNDNDFGRMGDTDDAFETLAFGVCNTDGVEGLSWDEVEQCEVSKNKYGFNHLDILVSE